MPFMKEEDFNFRKIVKTLDSFRSPLTLSASKGATSPQHKKLELAEKNSEVDFLESVLILCSY